MSSIAPYGAATGSKGRVLFLVDRRALAAQVLQHAVDLAVASCTGSFTAYVSAAPSLDRSPTALKVTAESGGGGPREARRPPPARPSRHAF